MAKILLADDSPVILKIGNSYLSKGSHTVVTAQDGNEAVEKTRSEKPDIVFLDAEMPDMDGWEACQALKKDPATSAVPVYLCTGHVMGKENEDRLKTVGAEGFIQKPFKQEDMLALVEKHSS